jgi:hypothetical protein
MAGGTMGDQEQPRAVYGWALRVAPEAACTQCGMVTRWQYHLERQVPGGWGEVAGERRCLRCWVGGLEAPDAHGTVAGPGSADGERHPPPNTR